jgi:hypothetical protein
LGEGMIFLILQRFGHIRGVADDILWISSLTNLVLFNLVAAGWWLIAQIFPRYFKTTGWLFVFLFLTALDWLGIFLFDELYNWTIFLLSLGVAIQAYRMVSKRIDNTLIFFKRSFGIVFVIFICVLVGIPLGDQIREVIAQ